MSPYNKFLIPRLCSVVPGQVPKASEKCPDIRDQWLSSTSYKIFISPKNIYRQNRNPMVFTLHAGCYFFWLGLSTLLNPVLPGPTLKNSNTEIYKKYSTHHQYFRYFLLLRIGRNGGGFAC